MKVFICCVVVVLAGLDGALLAADIPPAPEKRELLSDHHTVARFAGIAYHRCMGRTALCPDNCGDSGDFAFDILGYVKYSKQGDWLALSAKNN